MSKITVHDVREASYGRGSFNPNHPAFYDPDYYSTDDNYEFDEGEIQGRIDQDVAAVKKLVKEHGAGDNLNVWGEVAQDGDWAKGRIHVEFGYDHFPTDEEIDACDVATESLGDFQGKFPWDDGDISLIAEVDGKRVNLDKYNWWYPPKRNIPKDILEKATKYWIDEDLRGAEKLREKEPHDY